MSSDKQGLTNKPSSWEVRLGTKPVLIFLFATFAQMLMSCSLLSADADVDFPIYHWPPRLENATLQATNAGGYTNADGYITHHLDLTALHGEREFTRNARFVDIDGDGDYEILSRTMNENRIRALDLKTGQTLWVSPMVLPATQHPQASQMAVGDLDSDPTPEAIIVTYDGYVLCIDGRDGAIQWKRKLDYKINNPRLELKQITDDPGLELALTVGNRVSWNYMSSRGRINNMREPSLLVLQSDGSDAWFVESYDVNNGGGHNTWTYDIDGDGLSEVFAVGEDKLVVFDHDGERLFTLPVQNGEHADQVRVGEWASGPSIFYTDGIKAIAVASMDSEVLQRHRIRNRLNSHLQDIVLIPSAEGPRLLAQNIRAKDSKMIMYNQQFKPLWAAELRYAAAMQYTVLLDWDGDGNTEIAVGSLEAGTSACSLEVMGVDGSPLYWHGWEDQPLCWPLDAEDLDGDGSDELLLGVGRNLGDEGRYSLPDGAHMHLYVVEAHIGTSSQ